MGTGELPLSQQPPAWQLLLWGITIQNPNFSNCKLKVILSGCGNGSVDTGLCKHEDLSSDPKSPCNCWVWWCVPVTTVLRQISGPAGHTQTHSCTLCNLATVKGYYKGHFIKQMKIAQWHTKCDSQHLGGGCRGSVQDHSQLYSKLETSLGYIKKKKKWGGGSGEKRMQCGSHCHLHISL